MIRLLLCWLAYAAFPMVLHAQEIDFSRPLIADVSIRNIQIHSGFNGTSLLFYGARNAPGDVIIALHGPDMAATIRRKDQVGGVWMVVEQSRYNSIPSFYRHASTEPLRAVLTPKHYEALSLGNQGLLAHLHAHNPKTKDSLHDALLSQLKKRGWVSTLPNKVEYFGDTLFKATIGLPNNMPKGGYLAEVLLVYQGRVLSSQTIPIIAEKIGLDAWLSKHAHEHPWAYGFAAVFLALFGGWLGNRMLGK
jgi:uncharacterized protein (TIGR02186 family)